MTVRKHFSWTANWAADRSGSTMPIFALCIGALLSIVATLLALTIDSGAASDAQATADTAAIAGATAFVTSSTPKAEIRSDHAQEQARIFATKNSEYTLVDLDVQTVTEDAYGQQTTIHVELEFQPVNVAARWMGRSGTTAIRRKATAEAVWGFPLCALSLADDGAGISTVDNVTIKAENCILWTNSTDGDSMNFEGGKVEAKEMCSAGGVSGASRASPAPQEKCDVIPDPLENWGTPTPGSCPEVGEVPVVSIADLREQFEFILRESFDQETFESEVRMFYAALESYASGVSVGEEGGGLGLSLSAAEVTLVEIAVGGHKNALQYINNHPYFYLYNGSLGQINVNGLFATGAAEGMTIMELAQLVGEIDNVDPEDYADDVYVDTPTVTLSPGTYCGLDIWAGHVEFSPGTYFIKDAPLVVRRRGTMTGEGVTIVLSGENASFNVLDEARLTLSGPETGETAGFALIEDKAASMDNTPRSRLTGSGVIDAIGTIYLPRHDFAITGNGAGKQASPLLQVVTNRLMMSDEGELNIKFDTSKTKVPVGIKPERTARLVN